MIVFTRRRNNCKRILLLSYLLSKAAMVMTLTSKASKFASSTSIVGRTSSHRRSFFQRTPMTMMPEGPEVRTVVKQLQGAVGRRLAGVEFLSGRYSLQNPPSGYEDFQLTMQQSESTTTGGKMIDVIQQWNCKGKFIYIVLDDGVSTDAPNQTVDSQDYQRSIWITLGMTGRFVNEQTHLQQLHDQRSNGSSNHARWALNLVSRDTCETKRVYYYDQRGFGTLKFCLSKQQLDAKLQSLGPDVLQSAVFTLSEFRHVLSNTSPSMNICKFLMNQSKIAGVGNYILAESLYRAKIDPFATVGEILTEKVDNQPEPRSQRLFEAIQSVAQESYDSQRQQQQRDTNDYKTFEMYCYGRTTCNKGNLVYRMTNGPHGKTIWYTEEQLFMPLKDRMVQHVPDSDDDEMILDEIEQQQRAGREVNSAVDELLKGLVEPSWKASLVDVTGSPLFAKLATFLQEERLAGATVYPPHEEIFTALNLCPLSQVRVVIIGQDPYHGPGQGHGLAFSVKRNVRPLPPSLKNIIREAVEDVGIDEPKHGNLEHWARQGVLLLNTVLTVRRGQANSHAKKGWEEFTDACIRKVNEQHTGVVFLLWGNPAAKKASFVDPNRHDVIKTSHPSPLGASKTDSPFLGSRCFSRANLALEEQGKTPIDWTIQ
ncbi:hypothetical protein MPSEU_000615800 [Mayamaea pseudoterrestris]|nr:hypothetical protein MPSEU_000615800 [Mayamaea pseudoterrestris]